MATLVAADAPRKRLDGTTLTGAYAAIGPGGAVALLVISAALAVSLQPLQFRLVQLLEGYWPAWFPTWIVGFAVTRQLRRRQRIMRRVDVTWATTEADARVAEQRSITATEQLRQRFPARDRVLPTALGNALRAGEDATGRRYGLQSVVIWPRLFHLLPDRVRQGLDDEVTQLDVSARLSVTWALAALTSSGVLVRHPIELWHHLGWLLVVGLVVVLARLSYLAAIESAIAQGVDVEIAIDLYRDRVVDALRFLPAVSLSHERVVFGQVCDLLVADSPPDWDAPLRRASGASRASID